MMTNDDITPTDKIRDDYEKTVDKKNKKEDIDVEVITSVDNEGITDEKISVTSNEQSYKKGDLVSEENYEEQSDRSYGKIDGYNVTLTMTQSEYSAYKEDKDDKIKKAQYSERTPLSNVDATYDVKHGEKRATVVAGTPVGGIYGNHRLEWNGASLVNMGSQEIEGVSRGESSFQGNPNTDSFMQAAEDYKNKLEIHEQDSSNKLQASEDNRSAGIADPNDGAAVAVVSSREGEEDFLYANSGLGNEYTTSIHVKGDRATMVSNSNGQSWGVRGEYNKKEETWELSPMSREEVKAQMLKDRKNADKLISKTTKNRPGEKINTAEDYKNNSANIKVEVDANSNTTLTAQEIALRRFKQNSRL
jgi:hypothetical protein